MKMRKSLSIFILITFLLGTMAFPRLLFAEESQQQTPETENIGTSGSAPDDTANDTIAGETVTVNYIDDKGNILETLNLMGNVGETYTSTKKDIAGYEFKELQGSASGTFTDKVQTVTYVYTAKVDETVNKKEKAVQTVYDDVWLQSKIYDILMTSDGTGTITLPDDVILQSTISVYSYEGNTITIDGNGHSLKLADGFSDRHIVTTGGGSVNGTLILKNLSIIGHNTTSPGMSNTNRIKGGGLHIDNNITVVLDNTVIKGNHSESYGGAGMVYGGSSLVIKNKSLITENSTDSDKGGGGFELDSSIIEVKDSTFSNNSTYNGAGGGIRKLSSDGEVIANNSSFINNYAKGVVENRQGAQANCGGGAIATNKLNATNSVFKDNVSEFGGGAIYTMNGDISSENTEYINNISGGNGGAIYFETNTAFASSPSSERLVSKNDSFVGNQAKGKSGGAIHIPYTYLTVDGTRFSDNNAFVDGMMWDVDNPKGLAINNDFQNQYSMADFYKQKITSVSEISKAISSNVDYSNIFNNHDVNYQTSYEVIFRNEDGSEQTVLHTAGQKLTPPNEFLTKPGKVFLGWAVDSIETKQWIPTNWDLAKPHYFYDDETMKLTGSLSVYGVWADAADITYHLNDGSDKTLTKAYQKDKEVKLPNFSELDNTWIVPTDKVFAGWALSANKQSNETLYQSADMYLLKGNTDLYARYVDEIHYQVIFDTQGGSVIPPYRDVHSGSLISKPADPTKQGYIFDGWYGGLHTIRNSTLHCWDFASDKVMKNTELDAKWLPATDTAYTVEHYVEDTGNTYTLKDIETLRGTTDATVSATIKTYAGYTYNEQVKESKIKGAVEPNGSLVLKVYYTKNSVSPNLDEQVSGGNQTGIPKTGDTSAVQELWLTLLGSALMFSSLMLIRVQWKKQQQ